MIITESGMDYDTDINIEDIFTATRARRRGLDESLPIDWLQHIIFLFMPFYYEVCNILVAWGAEFFFLKVCGECQTLLKISKLIFHHGVVDTLRLVTILEGNPVISFNFDFLL